MAPADPLSDAVTGSKPVLAVARSEYSAKVDFWTGVTVSGAGGEVSASDIAVFSERHGMALPVALAELYQTIGVGTFGSFLHFEPPDGILTHRGLIEHLLDDDDEDLLEETGDVLMFARSDNGDMCGWHPNTEEVVRLIGFDELPLAESTHEFLSNLPTTDYFGIGVLEPAYCLHEWMNKH